MTVAPWRAQVLSGCCCCCCCCVCGWFWFFFFFWGGEVTYTLYCIDKLGQTCVIYLEHIKRSSENKARNWQWHNYVTINTCPKSMLLYIHVLSHTNSVNNLTESNINKYIFWQPIFIQSNIHKYNYWCPMFIQLNIYRTSHTLLTEDRGSLLIHSLH